MEATSLRIPNHVRSIIDPDGAVLMDLKKGQYYSLNGVGADIWAKLEQGLTAECITLALTQETNASQETVERDVSCFLTQLRDKHLLEIGT